MDDNTGGHPAGGRDSGFTFADVTEDLLWPKLLRSPGLALSPGRWGLGFFVALVCGLFAAICDLVAGEGGFSGPAAAQLGEPLSLMGSAIVGLSPALFVEGLLQLAVYAPWRVISGQPWVSMLAIVLLLPVMAVGGGAICRSAALSFSQGVSSTWTESLGFSIGRWRSMLSAIVTPFIFIAVIALCLAAAGWVLLSWPVVNLLGAVLYVFALVLSVLVVLVALGVALGGPVLIPAVACEGTDGLDAVQRAFAYVFGKPVRLIVYWLIALVLFIVAFQVVFMVASHTVRFANSSAATWLGPDTARLLERGTDGAPGGIVTDGLLSQRPGLDWAPAEPPQEEISGIDSSAAWVLGIWSAVVNLLVAGYVVSFFFCVSTVLYLILRRINDGQDIAELWMPGMVEATMAQSMAGRAAAAGTDPSEAGTRLEG